MDWIMLVIAFILGAISMFMMVCIGYAAKQEEPVNRVHFYVARDKNGKLWLYIGKPFKGSYEYRDDMNKGVCLLTGRLNCFRLNCEDYKDLKWEDEPVEVFVNMED